jgi:hypothetical protein
VGTRKPDGYGFGQNFKPVMGTGFLMDVNIFHGYGFGIAKPGGFVPVAISTQYKLPVTDSVLWSCNATKLDCVNLSGIWLCKILFCIFFKSSLE